MRLRREDLHPPRFDPPGISFSGKANATTAVDARRRVSENRILGSLQRRTGAWRDLVGG